MPIEHIINPPPPPEGSAGTAATWKVDTEFNLLTLHGWVVQKNPEGIYAPLNPILP